MADIASLLPIVGIFLVFWLLVIRPASKRQKQTQAIQRGLSVGDRVITSSGFFGTIASLDDDKVGLLIADGVVVTAARQAIVGVPDPAASLTDHEAIEPGEAGTDPETGPDTGTDTGPGQAPGQDR
ncbi:preprotein translocase subunit YajC [Nocardioides donggukensis]|uniref:Preprotein translocase subunit YajC n=1 Tax=Nocardioides donggukensis TaxID=2774019 RepID=A0A927Q180_9ACTN|nr:preprotein translocase subunit YajC [Nocardioides donggukensis]MBD8869777.1 preprotein translocase subunit YajC [Nocardioides donggukensis]